MSVSCPLLRGNGDICSQHWPIRFIHALNQPHRIRLEAAKARAAAPGKDARPLDPAEALQQPADCDLRLHAGERHAGTGVNAGAEGEMAVRLSADIEAVGIGKL